MRTIKKLTVDEIAQFDGVIEVITVQGAEVEVPEGVGASDIVAALDLPLNVAFELHNDDTKLEVSIVTVGSKGL